MSKVIKSYKCKYCGKRMEMNRSFCSEKHEQQYYRLAAIIREEAYSEMNGYNFDKKIQGIIFSYLKDKLPHWQCEECKKEFLNIEANPAGERTVTTTETKRNIQYIGNPVQGYCPTGTYETEEVEVENHYFICEECKGKATDTAKKWEVCKDIKSELRLGK